MSSPSVVWFYYIIGGLFCSHFASSSARFCCICSICLSNTAIFASSSTSRFFLNNVNDSFCFRSSPICFCAWSISFFARFFKFTLLFFFPFSFLLRLIFVKFAFCICLFLLFQSFIIEVFTILYYVF